MTSRLLAEGPLPVRRGAVRVAEHLWLASLPLLESRGEPSDGDVLKEPGDGEWVLRYKAFGLTVIRYLNNIKLSLSSDTVLSEKRTAHYDTRRPMLHVLFVGFQRPGPHRVAVGCVYAVDGVLDNGRGLRRRRQVLLLNYLLARHGRAWLTNLSRGGHLYSETAPI